MSASVARGCSGGSEGIPVSNIKDEKEKCVSPNNNQSGEPGLLDSLYLAAKYSGLATDVGGTYPLSSISILTVKPHTNLFIKYSSQIRKYYKRSVYIILLSVCPCTPHGLDIT